MLAAGRGPLRRSLLPWQASAHDEARSRVSIGAVLRAVGDVDAADLQLQRALDSFEQLGATFDVVRVLEMLGKALPQSRVVRTFMFTDIEESTALLARIGDAQWSDILRWHDKTLRGLFERFDGQEIKQRGGGDGFFVAFTSAASALDCALAIQQAMNDGSRERGFAIRVRVGVHEAEVTRSVDDYGGRGVHEAARIAALATGGEVLASTRTLESAGSRHQASRAHSAALKGLADPVHIASLRMP